MTTKNSLAILIRRPPYGQNHAAEAIRHMGEARSAMDQHGPYAILIGLQRKLSMHHYCLPCSLD